jgi:hypothetical protein
VHHVWLEHQTCGADMYSVQGRQLS